MALNLGVATDYPIFITGLSNVPNGDVTLSNTALTLTGTNASLNIFQINPYDVANSELIARDITSINIVVPNGSTILVNWSDLESNTTDFTFQFDTLFAGVPMTPEQGQYLIWNIPFQNMNLTLKKDMYGTLFAPKARLKTDETTIYGEIIAFHIMNEGACVSYPFLGELLSSKAPLVATTCFTPQPLIEAANICLIVGDSFDPLERVTACDWDGTNITDLVLVFLNNVDTTQPGLYTVTYQVTSPTNENEATKQIYVQVLAQSFYHQAVSDIIESIALEQAALSHILNAEGEKIQKALAMNLLPEELIELNDSVKDMVNTISHLELILHGKLEIVKCEICPEFEFPAP